MMCDLAQLAGLQSIKLTKLPFLKLSSAVVHGSKDMIMQFLVQRTVKHYGGAYSQGYVCGTCFYANKQVPESSNCQDESHELIISHLTFVPKAVCMNNSVDGFGVLKRQTL